MPTRTSAARSSTSSRSRAAPHVRPQHRASGDGALSFAPDAIAFGPGGSILASDRENHRINRYSAAGAYQSSFGEFGDGLDGTLQIPEGIDYDPDVGIVVTDVTQTVQIFNVNGSYLRGWDSPSDAPYRLRFATDVDVSPAGDVVVTDSFGQLLKRFNLADAPQPEVRLLPESHDFGSVEVGETSETTASS